MRMTGRTKRTPPLIAAVAVLVAANAWWFWPRADPVAAPSFRLANSYEYNPMGGAMTTPGGQADLEAAPEFDPSMGGWKVAGRPVSDLHPYMKVNVGGYAATDTAPFLLVKFRAEATTEEVRKAFLTLARQKICLVALADAGGPQASADQPEVEVRRIVSVMDDAGKPVSCPAPHNPFGHQSPAAASSASI